MVKHEALPKLKRFNTLVLMCVIFFSCALLILFNFYTIKILSTSRAWVNGESQYSKGQIDAVRHLITYIYSENPSQWEMFKEELSVPQGDHLARVTLTNNGSIGLIKKGLIAGKNHEEDLDDMIWLFKNFKSVLFLKKAIHEWEQGDVLIHKINLIGNEIHQKIQASQLDEQSKQKTLSQISAISDELNINEQNFSNTLGEGTRKIRDYLIYLNIFFILIIISAVSLYYSIMVKKLMISRQEIVETNKNLVITNIELDKFVYNTTHDLRSPIASLKGLIEVIKSEDDINLIKSYLDLMTQNLDKQDQFISDIIDYSKNKKQKTSLESLSLKKIINDAIAQFKYIENVNQITFKKEINLDIIYNNSLRLQIILNNIISNAIKYAVETKEKKWISIKTYSLNKSCIIEIEDNGIGIKKEFQSKIFDMFFVTNSNKGTGLGLYIVKEAVENLNGNIIVESEINVGSKFTITLPIQEKI